MSRVENSRVQCTKQRFLVLKESIQTFDYKSVCLVELVIFVRGVNSQ